MSADACQTPKTHSEAFDAQQGKLKWWVPSAGYEVRIADGLAVANQRVFVLA